MSLAFLGAIALLCFVISGVLTGIFHFLDQMLLHNDSKIVLLIVGIAVAWCAFRGKKLSKWRKQ
jgi:uncharacterized membrane protein (DUF441 family)